MESLKSKTISGFFWSFSDNIVHHSIQFVVGIILARLLSPSEFGLIGMIAIFIAVSQTFVNSGFGQALIRKKNVTQEDFSTVFLFNLGVSIIFFLLVFSLAGNISVFFNETLLKPITQVFSINLVITSLALVQRTRLIKDLNFKAQTLISFISNVISGLIAIYLAYNGYGVWSLVYKTIINNSLQTILLWFANKWIPSFLFSKKSFGELFHFGYKLLLSSLIDTLYRNVYLLVIGKFFSATQLGFYTRADQFKKLPSENINTVIGRVSYPVLSQLQDNPEKLKKTYKKIIKSTMFITFLAMFGMAAIAEPMILVLIGEKWLQSVSYLQLLCFVGMMYPLHSLNLTMLNVKGRSDLFFKLEIIKKIMAIPVIIIGIFIGIHAMIIGMIFNSLIAFLLNSYYSGQMVNYPTTEQIKDLLPLFLYGLAIGAIVYIISLLLHYSPLVILAIQLTSAILLVIISSELIKNHVYLEIKSLVTEKMSKPKKND